MFQRDDEKYLMGVLSRNEAILFLGAGFSHDAKNQLNENIPLGSQFSKMIWDFMDYKGVYSDDPLPLMYQVLLKSGKKKILISDFLEKNFLISSFPDSYFPLIDVFWYRIYTTNVDDLIEKVYKKSKIQRLEILQYPDHEPKERNQFLETQQIIYMHGKLPCDPHNVIFSTEQYANGSIKHQPFYEQFVREYSTHTTIFIGSQLEEPLFWQYIEARKDRSIRGNELRPRSFLISPKISQPKKEQLKEYNIVAVEGYANDFLEWIKTHAHELPTRDELIIRSHPDLENLVQLKGYLVHQNQVNEFTTCFERVHKHKEIKANKRSNFLLGFSPTWSDLYNDYDAPRNITKIIVDEVSSTFENDIALKIVTITGNAGCGKSTILKRIGITLAQEGKIVFFTNSEKLPSTRILSQVFSIFDERVILLFDNAEIALNYLPGLVREVENIRYPPIVIIASRTNDFDRLSGKSRAITNLIEHPISLLEKNEIEAIINALDKNGLLGYLQGLTKKQRIHEFEIRAKKQLLVSMREATLGRGFDEILQDEFDKIEPPEAKAICTCIAIATHLGYSLTKEEIISISELKPADTLNALNRNLSGIIVLEDQSNNNFLLRHRTIADFLVEKFINRDLLKKSYIQLLDTLASVIRGKKFNSREFRLYRELVNHATIFYRFNKNIETARNIYESMKDRLSYDFHFWLQYGSLELESGGDLNFAENYLSQADSIQPGDNYVLTAMGHLNIKKGIHSRNYTEALKFRNIGDDILYELIQKFGYRDPYYYHVFCHQTYYWIKKWIDNDEDKKIELKDVLDICKIGCSAHPKNTRLDHIREVVERALYYLGIEPENRPPDPEIMIRF